MAVISALRPETEELLLAMENHNQVGIRGWPTWTGSLDDRRVVLAQAGLGKVNTAALTAIIWERYRISTVIFTGVAGGLDPGLDVGDIVIGERTIQHDAGVLGPEGLERYQAGHIPFFNPTDEFGYTPSPGLLEATVEVARDVHLTPVLDRQPKVRVGSILTGDQFLNDPETRDRLFSDLGAQAVEMEGAALGQVAARLGMDHIVIRSLSDLAGAESIRHFDRFLTQVAANSARLVLQLVTRLG